jgi:hypothetical protein
MGDDGKGLVRVYRYTMFLLIELRDSAFFKKGEVTYVAGQWVTVQRKLPDWATCVNERTVWPPLMISDDRSLSL